jgi:hypothetical protein
MTTADLLVDGFGRIQGIVHRVLEGLTPEQLTYRPDAEGNSIAWLIWHLTRIQDDHVAGAGDAEQVWTTDGWVVRFGLPFDPDATGYGHRSSDVAGVVVSGDLLAGYHDAVYEQTIGYVRGLNDGDLDRIVDERWDPPVSLGARLVSVISDGLQHAGQAAYVRGMSERR